MGVKSVRGGKYANSTDSSQRTKKNRPENDYDLEMKSITKNGKIYYVLLRADTGAILKSAPQWRNKQSPIKWAEKHGFTLINRSGN